MPSGSNCSVERCKDEKTCYVMYVMCIYIRYQVCMTLRLCCLCSVVKLCQLLLCVIQKADGGKADWREFSAFGWPFPAEGLTWSVVMASDKMKSD